MLYSQTNAQKADYKEYWKKVENFELKELPQSALAEVEKIYNLAIKESNEEQIIKTLIYRSKFTLELQEDAQLKTVNDLKKEIRSSKFPGKNFLESILADLYWQYFQQNRYKFYNRTKTEQKVDPVDFRTWDLQTLFEEVHQHYQNSLKAPEKLQKISVRNYSEILILEEDSRIYRPSLYDFLAHRTLNFYKSDEQNIQNPTYKFSLEDPDLLKKNEVFLQTTLASKDTLSQELNAIYLYKDLTRFHLKDKEPYALIDLTLERLNYIKNHLISDEKEKIYLATLKELKEEFKLHPASAEITWNIAKLYDHEANSYQPIKYTEDQFKRQDALELCEEAIRNFPKAKGTEKCRVLIESIKQQKLNITIEKYISVNTASRALISYRNLNRLYFNIFKVTRSQKGQFEKLSSDSLRLAFIRDLNPEKQWISPLKNEKDYQQHSTEVLIPELNSGTYLILAREKEKTDTNMLYAQHFFQVTDLSLVNINDPDEEIWQVINRNNGKPIKNAKVHAKSSQRYANRSRMIDQVFYSDKNGLIRFEKKNYNDVYFTISYKNEQTVFGDYYIYKYNYQKDPTEKIHAKAFLFTDRSIYRPGQTVFFKGILIQKNNDRSEVISNEEVTVTLYDVNNEEVKELELTTNEFGSFSGEFILPPGGLTGEFLIEVDEGNADNKFYDKIEEFEMSETYISVEEYKRPKFETKFNPVTESFQLNDSIKVTGKAISFSGAQVTGAQVKYRVVRTENIPSIYHYDPQPQPSSEQEITHGETLTDAAGNYNIEFKAIPDLKISKDLKPVFNYKVYADVTDINGETHSTETTVRVAYHLLEAEIDIAQNINKDQNDHKISVTAKNLNGEFVPTTGQLKIYRLKSPDRILRKSPRNAPDYPGFTEEEFKKLFPHDAWQEENNPDKWEKGPLVFEKEISTETTKEVILKNTKKWKSGKYIATFSCTDRLQQKIESERKFNMYSHSKKDISKEQLIRVTANKPSYQAGEKAVILLSAPAKDLFVTLSIEKDHKIIKRRIIHLSNESKDIEVPVNHNDTSGFAILYHTAFYNSFKTGNLNISVPYPENELQITTQTFKDRIQPGSEQQWSFQITGDEKDKITAEVLASMYDASLDQFKMHQWNFTPVTNYIYRSYNKATAGKSFGTIALNTRNVKRYFSYYKNQKYDHLNWFGFSFNNNRWTKQRYLNGLVDKYTKPEISSKDDQNLTKGYIFGVVHDETDVLPGVNVIVKGTNIGVQTDFDGKFKIKSKKGDVLIFSFVGMKTLKLKVKKDNTYRVKMVSDNNSLDEVVVTAYGISKQKSSIEIEEVAEYEDVSFALAGKVAGVEISPAKRKGQFNDLENDVNIPPPHPSMEKIETSLTNIKARTNFNETAFFYPDLKTDKDGNIHFNFTIPEALTRWKLQLLAHTKDLRTGYKQFSTITQKDLMVVPNVPRFLRETDTIVISSKITNLTGQRLNGTAQIQLTDALTGNDITQQLLVKNNQNKDFSTDAKNSSTVNWKLFIPKGTQAVQYRIVAKAGSFSDGEQNILPVLSNRMLVTETMTLQIRGNEKKTFTLDKLKNNTSKTLTNHKLTLEITSNPVWVALQAMPYLMEFPHECSEQIFSRFFANTLAAYLMNSNPKIEQVFNQWRSSDALISNLEKNQELKSILIQETPWLRDAQSETEQKKRLALLFDLNKMKNEQEKALGKLKQMQRNDGGFPWFSGGRYANRNITQHIIIGFGKLNRIIGKDHKLSPKNYSELLQKSISFLDKEILKDYNRLITSAKERYKKEEEIQAYLKENHTGNFQIQYLYMRSFFADHPLDKKNQQAADYYRNQSYAYWTSYKLYTRGLIAITAKKKGDKKIAEDIYRSLEEKSITNEEMGMYWKENQPSWYWYQSPVQTQTTMIEVFYEMGADDKTIDNLKLWLLKNKQTNSWKTTKATTNAIYALLTTGSDWLSENEMVKVKIGDKNLDPMQLEESKPEAGTGYFKISWNDSDIQPEMAEITLEKESKGVAFGGLYWQYFEDLDKITSAKTGIKITKELFLKKNTDEGLRLIKINKNSKLKPGDLIKVRIEIKSDREMEFIHLKDMRASGLEPVNTLSGYKYQDNLYYYESTKDASTNFFIDRLPKGVFVFEYDLRVNNQGNFSNGITTMQSMYAPEFSSHSKGIRVKIEK